MKQNLNRKQNWDDKQFHIADSESDESGFLHRNAEISTSCCNVLRWKGVLDQSGEHCITGSYYIEDLKLFSWPPLISYPLRKLMKALKFVQMRTGV